MSIEKKTCVLILTGIAYIILVNKFRKPDPHIGYTFEFTIGIIVFIAVFIRIIIKKPNK